MSTTNITDTIRSLAGTPFNGTINIFSRGAGAFPNGLTLVSGPTTITNGALSVALTPNDETAANDDSYVVFFQESTGARWRETWNVPVSAAAVSLAAVRSSVDDVLPALPLVAGEPIQMAADDPILDSAGNELVKFSKAASAVNELTIGNAATGFDVTLSATGGDTDIDLQLAAKGAGLVLLGARASAEATAGAATVNAQRGYVTSEALTTAAGAAYTLTLTNSRIAAASQVVATVEDGTNTQGIPVVGTVKVTAAGTAVIKIYNLHASQALNGTILISFTVF